MRPNYAGKVRIGPEKRKSVRRRVTPFKSASRQFPEVNAGNNFRDPARISGLIYRSKARVPGNEQASH